MFSIFKTRTEYSSVEDGDREGELKLQDYPPSRSAHVTFRTGPCSILVITILFLSSIASTWVLFFGSILQWQHSTTTSQDAVMTLPKGPSWVCQQPATRREWRALSEPEKAEYTTAVRCLATKPSKLRNTGTLYDDFPWVHKNLSSNVHASAPFLPWHRYFIHLYEKALKEECSFDGSLPYWDWSLDWSNVTAAPVWDPTTGLGGNGDGSNSVGNGRCVTTGPFAGMEVMFYDGDENKHCLSRGFAEEKELMELGTLIQPETIQELIRVDQYENFASELERRAHKFLSHSVGGDLSRFTGPNDPVFFLHHTNLDRLWWQWQQNAPHDRLTTYSGRANNNTIVAAALTDYLDMGGLSRNLQVSDVMETRGGQFCYGY